MSLRQKKRTDCSAHARPTFTIARSHRIFHSNDSSSLTRDFLYRRAKNLEGQSLKFGIEMQATSEGFTATAEYLYVE